MSAPTSSAGERIPEFDGIRGILSLLVVSGHVCWTPIFWYPGSMEFFFTISGFLITRILLRAPVIDAAFLRTYAIRRVLRIWPLYYFALLLYYGVAGWIIPHMDIQWNDLDLNWKPSWAPFLMAAAYLQYVDGMFQYPAMDYALFFGHSWSVAIEEQFYFLWPLLFIVLRKTSREFRWGMVLLIPLIAVAARCIGYIEYPDLGIHVLPARFDSLGGGILLAVLLQQPVQGLYRARLAWLFRLSATIGFVLLLPFLISGYELSTWKFPAFMLRTVFDTNLAYALLAFGAIGGAIINSGTSKVEFLRHPVLMHLGEISYSTYLLHIIVLVGISTLLRQMGIDSTLCYWILGVLVSVGVAHLSHEYIELSALRLKRYFPYARKPAVQASADGLQHG